MKIIIIICFTISSVFCYSQNKPVKDYYDNGQLKSESNWDDGDKVGLWRKWNEDGTLKSQTNY